MTKFSEAMELGRSLKERGWAPGNLGEMRVMAAMDAVGWQPRHVEQEFRLGKYRIDFAIPLLRLAIEADGYHHRTDKGRRSDRERDKQLSRWGWFTLRFNIDEATSDDLECTFRRLFDKPDRVMPADSRRVSIAEHHGFFLPGREPIPYVPTEAERRADERAHEAYRQRSPGDRL